MLYSSIIFFKFLIALIPKVLFPDMYNFNKQYNFFNLCLIHFKYLFQNWEWIKYSCDQYLDRIMMYDKHIPCSKEEQVLVMYRIKGEIKEYLAQMSYSSFKELEFLVPLDYCKIVNKKD